MSEPRASASTTAVTPIAVVGIGEDGWSGLTDAARQTIAEAELVIGSPRQLALVEPNTVATEVWPTDLAGAVASLRDRHPDERVVVLASGDPLHYGVGAALIRRFGPEQVHVLPHPSSVSLACARLGWPVESVEVLSAVGRPLAALTPMLHPGARIIVLTATEDGAHQVSQRLAAGGCRAELAVLERLGGPPERVIRVSMDEALEPTFRHDRLAVVAIEVGEPARPLGLVPGLPDDAFVSDGVHTKSAVRALTLSALAPLPGQLLWDVGAGSGTVAVEWCRTDPRCRAVAVEPRGDRRALIETNADRLGTPNVQVVGGRAPEALTGLATPNAIFVGGGAGTPGVIEACVAALRPGGRLVINAVTVESEQLLARWWTERGGDLRRIQLSEAQPLAGQHTFRPALPITQWTWTAPIRQPEREPKSEPDRENGNPS